VESYDFGPWRKLGTGNPAELAAGNDLTEASIRVHPSFLQFSFWGIIGRVKDFASHGLVGLS
jgi:hypothetical protein